jgi:hypothetical protein
MVRYVATAATAGNIVGHLPKGAKAQVIGKYSASWYALELTNGAGFVASRYISCCPEPRY